MEEHAIRVIVGTRESRLALWQTEWVVSQLTALQAGKEFEYRHIKTQGDKILDSPLAKIGDRGLFVKEIEEALLSREIDLAVHSMKDVPTDIPPALGIIAVSRREDPRDCLLSRKHRSFAELPRGAKLGTSSLRRVAQLRAIRPDLECVPIRGNLDTRVGKLDSQELDGIVLAAAGLNRLGGWDALVVERLSPELCLPAVGQGALGLEARKDDGEIAALVAPLNDPVTAACVTAERALLKVLEGGCQVPIGALAALDGGELWLRGVVTDLEGARVIKGERRGALAQAGELGRDLGEELLARGGQAILAAIRGW